MPRREGRGDVRYESGLAPAPAPHPSPLPREREPVLRNRIAMTTDRLLHGVFISPDSPGRVMTAPW